MKILLAFFILTAANLAVFAQTESKCFQNKALQGNRTINFKISGDEISGTFAVENDAENAKIYEFSGTLRGNRLKVKFDGNVMPDVSPSTFKDLNWRLENIEGREVLQIEFRGKNYQKNEYSRYLAKFETCEPDFATLAKQARRISFAKGASSAMLSLSFNNLSERKAFWLKVGKGQTVSVTSPGCGIFFYYPDETAYEEGLAIDVLNMENIAQAGDYLFVIRPAGELGECSTIFKVTN